MSLFIIQPGCLSLELVREYVTTSPDLALDPNHQASTQAAAQTVQDVLDSGKTVYGINTGFGALANQVIDADQLVQLQHNLIQSHACGVGEELPDETVRLMLLLKINSLARGFSGVSAGLLQQLVDCHNQQLLACIPSKGSVGASGDLAPLAHLAASLIGVGEVHYQSQRMTAEKALKKAGLQPLALKPKEGLALINGMQATNAMALTALLRAEQLMQTAVLTGALSVEAAAGSYAPFDARIHQARGQVGQQKLATAYRSVLTDSTIHQSHQGCERVQDPYCLRCQSQVMGACWDQLQYAADIIMREANAVSDNPLVFAEQGDILSGGNFHGQALAFVADAMAVAIAEIGSIAERRCALLVDKHFSGLPAFLTPVGGLNNGLMMPQVTAAALVSENKALAHPASVDSIPTSANQEDHVSMATNAARRLHTMLDNVEYVLAIELLCACQGLDLRAPLTTTPQLQPVHALLREQIAPHQQDRYLAPDIKAARAMIQSGAIAKLLPDAMLLS